MFLMSDVGQTEGHTGRLMTIKRGFIIKVQYYCDKKMKERNFFFGIYKKNIVFIGLVLAGFHPGTCPV